MNRRSLLKFAALFGAAEAMSVPMDAAAVPASAERPIVLYCDLAVDPKREQEMLQHFHNDFKPAVEKFEGYIDLKMLKLGKVLQGPAPASNINYRFQLTYKSEELRQRWVASDAHQKNWPLIENTLIDKDYLVLLTDSV